MDLSKPPMQFGDLIDDFKRFAAAAGDLSNFKADPRLAEIFREYRPWRKVRFIARDAGIAPERLWAAIKGERLSQRLFVPLPQGEPARVFSVGQTPLLFARLHQIDRAVGGGGLAAAHSPDGALAHAGQQARFKIRTLMDEAAESSMIEGASLTRRDAVSMLREGREPRNKSERMVFNNYRAMQEIKRMLDRPLSVAMLLELQAMLTDGTMPPEERGRLRREGENIRVWDAIDNEPIHTPPAASELPARLTALCDFANTEHTTAEFIHPLVKAAVLHFAIGYEHPFVDGNGRTARAVFYWHALKQGYGLFEYMSISEIIRKGTTRYPQAFVDCELDDGDLTYFVFYQLDVIEQALARLDQRLKREQERLKRAEAFVRVSKGLNQRQRLLLEHGLRKPGTEYTVRSHAISNDVSLVTARSDLEGLVRLRLMESSKRGREVAYRVAGGLRERLAKRLAK